MSARLGVWGQCEECSGYLSKPCGLHTSNAAGRPFLVSFNGLKKCLLGLSWESCQGITLPVV